VIVKLVNKTKKKATENHAIVMGQNLNIVRQKEQFLWNLAFRHCLASKAKFVFTFKKNPFQWTKTLKTVGCTLQRK
jgi:hypothetical protein